MNTPPPPSLCSLFVLTSIWSSNQGRTSALQGVQHRVIERSPSPRRGQLGELWCNIGRVWTRVGPTEGSRDAVLVSAAHIQRVTVTGVPSRPVIHRGAWRVVEPAGGVWASCAVWRALRRGLRPDRVAGNSVAGLRRAAGLQIRQAGYHRAHPRAGYIHGRVGVGVHITARGWIVSSLALGCCDSQSLIHVGRVHQQTRLMSSAGEDEFAALV